MAKGKILRSGTYKEIHDDPQVRALYFGNSPDA
jgi:ABC-type branched-subunit amino acid transport system ATPase component